MGWLKLMAGAIIMASPCLGAASASAADWAVFYCEQARGNSYNEAYRYWWGTNFIDPRADQLRAARQRAADEEFARCVAERRHAEQLDLTRQACRNAARTVQQYEACGW